MRQEEILKRFCAVTNDRNGAISVLVQKVSMRKIAKFNCKFPSVRTENSVYMRINFHPHGPDNSE